MSVNVHTFVDLCLTRKGTPYIFGAEASCSNPNPSALDCSELVEWACCRVGVAPTMPDGSWNQLAHCRGHGLGVSVDQGIRTYGALLFMGPDGNEHVAVSLGNGTTIEARGRAYGTGTWQSTGRPWSAAALIPGVTYGTPSEEDDLTPDQANTLNIIANRIKNVEDWLSGGYGELATKVELDAIRQDVAAVKSKVGA